MYDSFTTPWAQHSHLQEEMSHACLYDLWQSMRLGIEFLPGMRETAYTSNTSVFPSDCGALLPLVRSRACERLALLHQVRADPGSGELATCCRSRPASATSTIVHTHPGSNEHSLRRPSAVRADSAGGGNPFAECARRVVSAPEGLAHRSSGAIRVPTASAVHATTRAAA